MASITPIDRRRGTADSSGTDGADPLAVTVDDLRDAMDDGTRRLLQRRPTFRRGRVVPRALAVADLAGLTTAYVIATLVRGGNGALGSGRELLLFGLSLPCWVFVANLHGLYHRDEERADHSTTDDIVGVFHLVTIGIWLLLVVSRLVGMDGPGVLNLAGFWVLAVCIVPLVRGLAREACKRSGAYQQNAVIVGAGDIGQLIGRKLIAHPEYGVNIVGFVDRAPRMRRPDLPEHLSILGGPERLPEIIKTLDVERVIIAFSSIATSELLELLRQLRPRGVQVDLVPWLFELVGPRVSVHAAEGLALIGLPPTRQSRVSMMLKRTIDVIGASIGLVVLSPLMAYIAVRIRQKSPGPVLFRQTRLGVGMNQFTALKFRTMKVGTDPEVHRAYVRETMSFAAEANGDRRYKLAQEDAVTDVGRWLRKTSLDELPQLINVLRGEMSLVGPRPCIPYEADNFQPHHLERFTMPQGMTGLWQVTARANCTYLEALELDVAYVRGWSLGLDLRLLLRTPLELIRQRSA